MSSRFFRQIGGPMSGYDNGVKDVCERIQDQQAGRTRLPAVAADRLLLGLGVAVVAGALLTTLVALC